MQQPSKWSEWQKDLQGTGKSGQRERKLDQSKCTFDGDKKSICERVEAIGQNGLKRFDSCVGKVCVGRLYKLR